MVVSCKLLLDDCEGGLKKKGLLCENLMMSVSLWVCLCVTLCHQIPFAGIHIYVCHCV